MCSCFIAIWKSCITLVPVDFPLMSYWRHSKSDSPLCKKSAEGLCVKWYTFLHRGECHLKWRQGYKNEQLFEETASIERQYYGWPHKWSNPIFLSITEIIGGFAYIAQHFIFKLHSTRKDFHVLHLGDTFLSYWAVNDCSPFVWWYNIIQYILGRLHKNMEFNVKHSKLITNVSPTKHSVHWLHFSNTTYMGY